MPTGLVMEGVICWMLVMSWSRFCERTMRLPWVPASGFMTMPSLLVISFSSKSAMSFSLLILVPVFVVS